MTNNKNEEISRLIENEFDSRMEAAVISYILDEGIKNLQNETEESISKIDGEKFMTAEFLQALVRTAVKICKTYRPMEIMCFIRMSCQFAPFPKSVDLYKEDFTETGWSELCGRLDEDEESCEIKVLIISEE